MGFWLGSYIPSLRDAAAPFLLADDLHPSLLAMRRWTLRRYERIEQAFRAVGGDYRAFPARYWPQARHELTAHGVAE
jgi:phytoene synthase